MTLTLCFTIKCPDIRRVLLNLFGAFLTLCNDFASRRPFSEAVCCTTIAILFVLRINKKCRRAFCLCNSSPPLTHTQSFFSKSTESSHGAMKHFSVKYGCRAACYKAVCYIFTGLRTICNVSGNRCESDCRCRGRDFDPGPVPYFR